MPRRVKKRRQRKAVTVKKNVAKGEQTSLPGKMSGNLECRVIIDENLAKHINRDPLEQEEEVTITSSDELAQKTAAQKSGGTPKGTLSAWELGNALDNDEEKMSSSDLVGTIDDDELLDQIWKDLDEIFPSGNKEVTKGVLSPNGDCVKKPAILEERAELAKKAAYERGETPKGTCNACELENVWGIIDEAELDHIWKDLQAIFPSSEEIEKDGNAMVGEYLESKDIIDRNLPLLALPSQKDDNSITSSEKLIMEKAAHQRDATPEGKRIACELENDLDKNELELDKILKELYAIYPPYEKAAVKADFCLNIDYSTPEEIVGDSGQVPPKFFGKSGYFMLTGTNSQLQQQLKDLAARNIVLESFVELPHATADIVEQQMTNLVQNRGRICDKYDLLAPRRVPRQKKQRNFPN